jgi:hypothetical protein
MVIECERVRIQGGFSGWFNCQKFDCSSKSSNDACTDHPNAASIWFTFFEPPTLTVTQTSHFDFS